MYFGSRTDVVQEDQAGPIEALQCLVAGRTPWQRQASTELDEDPVFQPPTQWS
jgi:hypothetical protein